jgi:two-component system sensor histidine kinase DesK
MKAWLIKIDSWLLPRGITERFSPYIWLAYLPLFFVPVFIFDPSITHQIQVVVITLVFIAVYFASYWVGAKRLPYYIVAMCLLGTAAALITLSAGTLFIYASALCCRLRPARKSFIGLALILAWIVVISAAFSMVPNFYVIALIFSALVGFINIYQYSLNEKKQELILSRQETQQLAKVAERERIARDLHDLIGHTFSVITLKADLAGRLIDKNGDADIAKARVEIQQLEDISRSALSQVREVVSGYRSSDLIAELANAKHVFSGVDISFDYQLDGATQQALDENKFINKELAIVLRELVTNVIKHAQASSVKVTLENGHQAICMRMIDDGHGFESKESNGFGLIGIHERMDKLNGVVKIITGTDHSGCTTEITVPFSPH